MIYAAHFYVIFIYCEFGQFFHIWKKNSILFSIWLKKIAAFFWEIEKKKSSKCYEKRKRKNNLNLNLCSDFEYEYIRKNISKRKNKRKNKFKAESFNSSRRNFGSSEEVVKLLNRCDQILMKMSSQDPDVDINVVSSPEHSPQPDYNATRIKFQAVSSAAPTTMSNRIMINTISDSSRLSPAEMPADNSKLSANSGYTSFTISSILSRNDPKKDSITSSSNLPFIDANGGTVHDAAMLSRWANNRIFG